MKKLGLLVIPLLVIPFLASCNNGGGDKPEEVKFSLSGNPTLEGKIATVNVDWTPTNTIRFESFTFTASPAKENTVTFEQTGDPRPMPVKITFIEDITEDISGTLSFKYENVTAKTKGESSISVTIPKPEKDPTLTKEEFDGACGFEGVQLLQVMQRNISDDDELGIRTVDNIVEISDLIYHATIITNHEGEMYDYFSEHYAKINQLSDTICTYTYRLDIESDWSTPMSDLTIRWFARPEHFNPLLIKDMTGYECNPSLAYENFKLIDGKYIYTGKATYTIDTYDARMELTFNHKKLAYCLFTVDDDSQFRYECTFEYENVTPVWPL